MKVDARKQLVRRERTELMTEEEQYKLLLRPGTPSRKTAGSSIKARVFYYLFMLAIGIAGTWACLWAMKNTSESEEVVSSMGLERVARSFDDIMSLLAIPVLMFTAILALYAAQQLIRLYRQGTTLSSERLKRPRRRNQVDP